MKSARHLIGVTLAVTALIGITSLFGNDYYLRIVFMMCVYYLCAAGMNVLVGYAGQKSLGQAGLFAAGAYAVALLTTRTELSPWLAAKNHSRSSTSAGSRSLQCSVSRASSPSAESS